MKSIAFFVWTLPGRNAKQSLSPALKIQKETTQHSLSYCYPRCGELRHELFVSKDSSLSHNLQSYELWQYHVYRKPFEVITNGSIPSAPPAVAFRDQIHSKWKTWIHFSTGYYHFINRKPTPKNQIFSKFFMMGGAPRSLPVAFWDQNSFRMERECNGNVFA